MCIIIFTLYLTDLSELSLSSPLSTGLRSLARLPYAMLRRLLTVAIYAHIARCQILLMNTCRARTLASNSQISLTSVLWHIAQLMQLLKLLQLMLLS